MKIIAIGRNYADHARELNNPIPTAPIIFMKPDTALLKNNEAFYHPSFSNDIHHEIEIVLKISKEGKHISEKFASTYYEEISLGIDFTARDIQNECKKNGWPWELAKAFDHSAPVGYFISKKDIPDINNIHFRLDVNGNTRQKGNTKNMLFSFDHIISFVSKYITLKKGDLIFTGTPDGVQKITLGDQMEGYLGDKKLLDFNIK